MRDAAPIELWRKWHRSRGFSRTATRGCHKTLRFLPSSSAIADANDAYLRRRGEARRSGYFILMKPRRDPYRLFLKPPRKITQTLIARALEASVAISWGIIMKRLVLAGVSLTALSLFNAAHAADANPPLLKAPSSTCDPYKNYSCLDSYLGSDFFTRFVNYYRLEWGHDSAPSDPKAPPSRRDY
jgi:hypothetical protein